jgi:peptidoglycan/LPS O-acetylase OafA/YrhL
VSNAKTFESAYDPARNNLNFLRLLFAVLVIASHSYFIVSKETGAFEPLYRLTNNRVNLGDLAVNGFFAISGFLLAGSWCAGRGGLWGFVSRRVARIYPAFAVCVLLCIGVVGPLAVEDVRSYFADPHTYRLLQYLYFGRFWNSLPGAFPDNPMPGIINSSLWTIKYELYCYLAIILLGVAGMLRGRWVTACALFWLAVFNVLVATKTTLPYALDPYYMPRLLTFFLGGAALYLCRGVVPYRAGLFLVAIAVLLGTMGWSGWATLVLPTAGLYSLFYVACLPGRLNAFGRRHDLSYGVYLYGWPIQQLVVHYGIPGGSPWSLTAISVALSFVAAGASWFLIEAPSLRLVKAWSRMKTRSENAPSPADFVPAPTGDAA